MTEIDETELIRGDAERQAVASLKGYAYQLILSAIAWTELQDGECLHLEVAEDYAKVARSSLLGVQVKHVSGSITLQSDSVTSTIDALFLLRKKNPDRRVRLAFLTTSKIGRERAKADQVENAPGLEYWLAAASGRKSTAPIRARLKRLKLGEEALSFLEESSDSSLRTDLLKSIIWLTDQDDIEACRKKLIDRVIEIGDARGFAASLCENIADSLVNQILKSSTEESAVARSLTRADLIRIFDSMSTITLRVTDLNQLLPGALGNQETKTEIVGLTQRLVSVRQQPLPRLVARRGDLETNVLQAVGGRRTVWLYGMAGSGKSLLVRSVADQRRDPWSIVRLRGEDATSTLNTLDQVNVAIRTHTCEVLIIDDLEHLEDERVLVAVTSLLDNLGSIGASAIITSYQRPSRTRLENLGCGDALCLKVPSLSEAEIEKLVLESGGGPGWGRYIFLATGGGYPILVQALLQSLNSRDWPEDAKRSLEGLITQNGDIEAVRAETRRRLIAELPHQTRTLLYRTSLLIGYFERDLIDAIAESHPPIEQAGEALERLIGPWVERTADESYTLTPLVSNSGLHTLSKNEAASVHFAAAHHLISRRSISLDKADAILLHGLLGRNKAALLALVSATLRADEETLVLLDEYTMLGGLQTESPLLPDDPITSAQLRVQQVWITANSRKPRNLSDKWSAMQREVEGLETSSLKATLRLLAYFRVLLRPGIASEIPDFMSCVAQLPEIVKAAGADMSSFSAEEIVPSGQLDAVIFVHQICSVDNIATLVGILEDFCQLPKPHRMRLKSGFDSPFVSPGLAIKSAWAKEQANDGFDHDAAAKIYISLAKQLSSVGEPDFAAAAYETAAAILDESLDEGERALALLDEAKKDNCCSPTIDRARARILFHRNEYKAFLEILEPLEADRDQTNPVEEAFAWREIGVARGYLSDWSKAADAFERARRSAETSDTETMVAMQIGLLTDEAVAHWYSGDRKRAVDLLSQSYGRVQNFQDEAKTSSDVARRLFGYSVMWVSVQLDESSQLDDSFNPAMIPGFNSNPTPHPDIVDRPHPDLLILLYMLAKIERQVDGAGQINKQLDALTDDEASLLMEVLDIMDRWEAAKEEVDTDKIISLVAKMVDVECLIKNPTFDLHEKNLTQMKRGKVPSADAIAFDKHVDKAQQDLTGILLRLAMNGRAAEATSLVERISRLERSILGGHLVDKFRNRDSINLMNNNDPFECSARLVHLLEDDVPLALDEISIISIRALQVASIGEMAGKFGDEFRTWTARVWPVTMRLQSFALKRPPEAIAKVDAVLSELGPGYRGVAQILEAALPYTNLQIGATVKDFISAVAREGLNRSSTTDSNDRR